MSCILEFVVASDQSVLRFQLRVMLSIFRQVIVVVVIVVVGLVVEIEGVLPPCTVLPPVTG